MYNYVPLILQYHISSHVCIIKYITWRGVFQVFQPPTPFILQKKVHVTFTSGYKLYPSGREILNPGHRIK